MNDKSESTSALPVTVRFFNWLVTWSIPGGIIGFFLYLSTYGRALPPYASMSLRAVLVDAGLLMAGLLLTSGLVAFAEWSPEQKYRRGGLLKIWDVRRASIPSPKIIGRAPSEYELETERIKEEIESLERKKLFQQLQARRDVLRDEVGSVLR